MQFKTLVPQNSKKNRHMTTIILRFIAIISKLDYLSKSYQYIRSIMMKKAIILDKIIYLFFFLNTGGHIDQMDRTLVNDNS